MRRMYLTHEALLTECMRDPVFRRHWLATRLRRGLEYISIKRQINWTTRTGHFRRWDDWI